jgi:hypothetical protein
MRKNFAVVCALGIIGMQNTLSAQDTERQIAKQLVSIAVNPGSDYTRPGRAKFVSTLATYCGEVLKALPTNTPAEDAWVLAEGNTGDMEKIRRLVSSSEFARRELKARFEGCVEGTTNILRVQKLTERNDSGARSEAQEFVRIAFDFNNDNDILAYAARAGLSSRAWQLDFLHSVRKSLLVAALRVLDNK